jgi:subtilisin family serine protease
VILRVSIFSTCDGFDAIQLSRCQSQNVIWTLQISIVQLFVGNSMFFLLMLVLLVGVHSQNSFQADERTLQEHSNLNLTSDAWIVELYNPGNLRAIADIASEVTQTSNGHVGVVFEHILNGFVYHGNDIEVIQAHPHVKFVIPDEVITMSAQTIPTGIQRIYADTMGSFQMASSNCTCDAVVAIVDTGVDFSHSDLNINTAMSVDCMSGRCIKGLGYDDGGHGTHLAGIIGAIGNDQGVVGVCPGAEIWSIKSFSGAEMGQTSSVIAGLDYVAKHASKIDVVNMSWGMKGCNKVVCSYFRRMKNAGLALVAAAGNGNEPADKYSPACCSSVLSKWCMSTGC